MVSVAWAVFSARKLCDYMLLLSPLQIGHGGGSRGTAHTSCARPTVASLLVSTLIFQCPYPMVTSPWRFIDWPGHRDWWLLPAEFTVGWIKATGHPKKPKQDPTAYGTTAPKICS